AKFEPTSFGLSLASLIALGSKPVAELTREELLQLLQKSQDWTEAEQMLHAGEMPGLLPCSWHSFSVPKEIFRMIDMLSNHIGENFLSDAIVDTQLQRIRENLDTAPSIDTAFEEGITAASMIEALLTFLRSLPQAVIPEAYQYDCLRASANLNAALLSLTRIPKIHQNLFYYLVAFLKTCIPLGSRDDLVTALANRFGEAIFNSCNPDVSRARTAYSGFFSQTTRADFIRLFITNDNLRQNQLSFSHQPH
ncbi:hypothetical protein Ciccas_005657, partial [Cichlidogyrus casuarinus]